MAQSIFSSNLKKCKVFSVKYSCALFLGILQLILFLLCDLNKKRLSFYFCTVAVKTEILFNETLYITIQYVTSALSIIIMLAVEPWEFENFKFSSLELD